MNKFIQILIKEASKINVLITEETAKQFYQYMQLILDWNQKINLTAITEEIDIIQKHFIDSLSILKYIETGSSIIDVGTGAGFPGIPLKIVDETLQVSLLDSLNKRIHFLNMTIKELNLNNIKTIHSRAEDLGQNIEYRAKFDVVTSRAVASLAILMEYMLPLAKVGGICICMKGNQIEEEIINSEKALSLLGGKIETIQELILPDTDMKRNIVVIKKIEDTKVKYPRKAGIPSKNPLL